MRSMRNSLSLEVYAQPIDWSSSSDLLTFFSQLHFGPPVSEEGRAGTAVCGNATCMGHGCFPDFDTFRMML